MDEDRLFHMKFKPSTQSLPTVRKLMKIDHVGASGKQLAELQEDNFKLTPNILQRATAAINSPSDSTASNQDNLKLTPNILYRANAAINSPLDVNDKRSNFVVVQLPKLPTSKKSKEPAVPVSEAAAVQISSEGEEMKVIIDAEDGTEQQYMTILSEEELPGDEETEEYDYELEENDGKRYSNHSFAQPVKHKEKDNSSQSKAAVSKAAPFWKASAIVNGHVTELKLSDYKGRYIVLIFYPQDFSRVCQSELLAISDRISEFRALNAEVVACSVDSFLAHQVWCRTPRSEGGLANPKIALLSDPTHSISKDYGCFMPELGHTLRAYYIIDHRGIIRQITINDISVGRSTDELLRLVEAFQQTDETEASAPADWKSGQPLYS
ncbi:unnamed protein product [Bemisia tabaci]|uniref:thioredoxin-dependent peroxiredoxin n=1 Tax=Bemisia tabaci TaxID=7038 RepID=A0A9P0A8J0_BEMTA|nr:unnamed protein product [Bemisia tabaci]